MRVWELPLAGTILLDAGAWLALQLGLAYFCVRMPVSRFVRNGPVTRERVFERGGGWYEERLAIKRWKDRLPDGGALFGRGFAKRRLHSADSDYLLRFMAETRRGEITHWLAVLPAPLFFLWNDPASGWVMVGYAVAANLPCICVQRYNRLRFKRLLDRREGQKKREK